MSNTEEPQYLVTVAVVVIDTTTGSSTTTTAQRRTYGEGFPLAHAALHAADEATRTAISEVESA